MSTIDEALRRAGVGSVWDDLPETLTPIGEMDFPVRDDVEALVEQGHKLGLVLGKILIELGVFRPRKLASAELLILANQWLRERPAPPSAPRADFKLPKAMKAELREIAMEEGCTLNELATAVLANYMATLNNRKPKHK